MSYFNQLGGKMYTNLSKEELEKIRQEYEKTLPVCDLTAEELTKKIQKVIPDYHFDYTDTEMIEKRKKLSEKARKNMGDRIVGIFGDEHCRIGFNVFGGREEGGNYGDFIYHFLPKKMDDLKAADILAAEVNSLNEKKNRLRAQSNLLKKQYDELDANDKLPAEEKEKLLRENREALKENEQLQKENDAPLREKTQVLDGQKKELHRAITDYVRRNADKMLERLNYGSLEDLVDNWRELATFIRVCDMQNTVDKCPDGWYTKEEKQELHKIMSPVLDQLAEKEATLSLFSSSIGPMLDEKQILTATPKQLAALSTLKSSLEIFRPAPGKEDEEYGEDELEYEDKNSPFCDAALYMDMQRIKLEGLAREHFGLKPFNSLLIQDLDGKSLTPEESMEEMLGNHRPVYMMSDDPTATPILAYMNKTRFGIGEDAMMLFGESELPNPLPPFDESRKPTGITAWWDGICKSLGLNILRPRSCVDYENEKANYEEQRAIRDSAIKSRTNIFKLAKKDHLDEVREQIMDSRFKTDVARQFIKDAKLDIKEEDLMTVREKLTTLWDQIHMQQKALHENVTADSLTPEQRSSYAAYALTYALVEKRLMDNMHDLKKHNVRDLYPDVKALLDIPDKANTANKRAEYLKNNLNAKAAELMNSDEMKKLSGELTDDDLKTMCPERSDVKSIMKSRELMEKITNPVKQEPGIMESSLKNKVIETNPVIQSGGISNDH